MNLLNNIQQRLDPLHLALTPIVNRIHKIVVQIEFTKLPLIRCLDAVNVLQIVSDIDD